MPALAADSKTGSPARRRRWLMPALLIGLPILTWVMPVLIAWSPFRDLVLGSFFSRLDATVATGGASLGWFSPIVLDDVTIVGHGNNTLLKAGRIQSGKTLLGLLLNPSQPGSFRIENAVVQVHFFGSESDVEQALSNYLEPQDGSSAKPLALELEIAQSQIHLHDGDTARKVAIEAVQGKIKLEPSASPAVVVDLQGEVKNQDKSEKIEATLRLGGAKGEGELSLRTGGLDLAVLNTVWRRLKVDGQSIGAARGHCTYAWGRQEGKNFARLDGHISAPDLLISGALLRNDKLHLKQLELPCRLALVNSRLHLDQTEIACDLGTASLAGGLDLNGSLAGWLAEPGCAVSADLDLAALASQLPRTFRLQRGTQLTSGRLRLSAHSRKETSGVFWQAKLALSPVEGFTKTNKVSWPEPIALEFQARQGSKGLAHIERLHADSGFLKIEGSGTPEQFRLKADMNLLTLSKNLDQFVKAGAMPKDGKGWLELAVRETKDDTYSLELSGQFKDLKAAGLEDPLVDFRLLGTWLPDARVRFNETLIRTSAVQVRSDDLLVSLTPGKPILVGKAAIQGDLARIHPWLRGPAAGQFEPISGNMTAYVDFKEGDQSVPLSLDMHVVDFAYGPAAAPLWREPRLRLFTQGRFSRATEVLLIDRLFLESQALAGDARGEVDDVFGRKALDLQGVIKYDLEKLTPKLQAYLGSGCKIAGRDMRKFKLAGFLFGDPNTSRASFTLAELNGEAGLNWSILEAYGGELGPADLQLRLEKGWLRARPINTTMNGGKLLLQPSVRLEPGPVELTVQPGVALEKAKITPAMSASALGYALPALAHVSQIDGELSLRVDKVLLPLADPKRGEFQGNVHVHSARFGANAFVRELGVLFKVAPLNVQMKDCLIPVKMADGKVHHQNLELILPDMTVRTSGWVGVDGSLALVADMPIPSKWLPDTKLAAALAKQTIKLPIGGTLDQPRLDQPALREAMAQVLRKTAGSLLKQEIEDRLKKLFPFPK